MYDRQELNESIKKMNYARMFAAQATLTDFTKKFAQQATSGTEGVIKDIIGYLDQDLGKIFDVKLPGLH